jgi:hypothetical protein
VSINSNRQFGDKEAVPAAPPAIRKPWVAPELIVSQAKDMAAQVAAGYDGTDPSLGYQYGS